VRTGCAITALAAILTVSAGSAHADDNDHGKFERPFWKRVTLMGGALNDLGGGLGPSVAVGHKVGSFHLAAEYAVMHLWTADETSVEEIKPSVALGWAHRLGVTATIPITEWGLGGSGEVAFWLEAGAGAHKMPSGTWQPDAIVGWVAEPRGVMRGTDTAGGGFWFGARIQVVRHDDTLPEAGPVLQSTVAQRTPILDVGLLATFGWRWGR
jgi:hypothetical protein